MAEPLILSACIPHRRTDSKSAVSRRFPSALVVMKVIMPVFPPKTSGPNDGFSAVRSQRTALSPPLGEPMTIRADGQRVDGAVVPHQRDGAFAPGSDAVRFQSRTTWSWPDVTKRSPSGVNATLVIDPS